MKTFPIRPFLPILLAMASLTTAGCGSAPDSDVAPGDDSQDLSIISGSAAAIRPSTSVARGPAGTSVTLRSGLRILRRVRMFRETLLGVAGYELIDLPITYSSTGATVVVIPENVMYGSNPLVATYADGGTASFPFVVTSYRMISTNVNQVLGRLNVTTLGRTMIHIDSAETYVSYLGIRSVPKALPDFLVKDLGAYRVFGKIQDVNLLENAQGSAFEAGYADGVATMSLDFEDGGAKEIKTWDTSMFSSGFPDVDLSSLSVRVSGPLAIRALPDPFRGGTVAPAIYFAENPQTSGTATGTIPVYGSVDVGPDFSKAVGGELFGDPQFMGFVGHSLSLEFARKLRIADNTEFTSVSVVGGGVRLAWR